MITIPEALYWKYGVEGITTKAGEVTNWPDSLPELTQELIDAAEAEYLARDTKLKGVLFNGVMCSATKEDMWGLSAVEGYVRDGATVNFQFDNGNSLELSPANIDSFKAVWVPFRASFF